MVSFVHAAEDVGSTFGYHPRASDLQALLTAAPFSRLLVVGGGMPDVVAQVAQARTSACEIGLPRGLYWFSGLDSCIAMVVNVGGPTSDGDATAIDEIGDDSPLRDAYDWAEHLWDAAENVPSPAFAVGDTVVVHGGGDSAILTRKFVAGQWSYEVRVDGRPKQVPESGVSEAPVTGGPADWVRCTPASVDRFGATLTRGKLDASLTDTVFSFRATRTVFRPYQFKPVLRLLHTGATRILVADEVGLGKTIEAGLIWTELEARHAANRVLVVAPSSLVGKWQAEMSERFDFELVELDNAGLSGFLDRHREDRLPRRFAYVTSLERLRRWDGLDELADDPPQFDLVVVDEAHQMRNPDTRNHALGEQLGEWADARVFLTATPVNLGNADLASMLELLAPEDFDDPHLLELRLEPNAVLHRVEALLLDRAVSGADRVAALDELTTMTFGAALMSRPDFPALRAIVGRDALSAAEIVEARRYLSDFNALSSVITRTRKTEVDEDKALRSPQTERIVWGGAEHTFYEQYLTWCRMRADHIGMPLNFCMQMPLRLASACLPVARDVVLGSADDWTPRDEDDPDAAPVPASSVPPHEELVAAALALPDDVDSKFDRLRPIVLDMIEQGRRTLLFTFSRPTLAYLRRRLSPFARVAVMHGGVARDERRRIMTAFRAGEFDVLLANRVASEGLDFEFCSAVINYDLPWNPMEVEQRIGRIDRIGQQEEKIRVVNFVNEATIDEQILERVLDRIGVFERAIGALEPIIQSQIQDLQEAIYDFTLNAEQRAFKVEQSLRAIEENKADVERLTGAAPDLLVSNDVDVSGLERDLEQAGRYLGQRELAHLVHDWATAAKAPGITPVGDTRVRLRGNATMADQLNDVVRRGRRMQTEVRDLMLTLREEHDLTLVLDHEDARTTGGTLLTATHPLVLAAVAVPGHRHARFANVRVLDPDGVAPTGRYAVVLAKAEGSGARVSREIWGAAVDLNGREAPAAVPSALLAALARGDLLAAGTPVDADLLADVVEVAVDSLLQRQMGEAERRRRESDALAESRRIRLSEQLERTLSVVDRRLETARARGRGGLHMFEGQKRRARERYAQSLHTLDRTGPPELDLDYLAACYLEIVR